MVSSRCIVMNTPVAERGSSYDQKNSLVKQRTQSEKENTRNVHRPIRQFLGYISLISHCISNMYNIKSVQGSIFVDCFLRIFYIFFSLLLSLNNVQIYLKTHTILRLKQYMLACNRILFVEALEGNRKRATKEQGRNKMLCSKR